jgi:hypothetical protein
MSKYRKHRNRRLISRAAMSLGLCAAGVLVDGASASAATNYCNTPYMSGHSVYMRCFGDVYGAVTIRCSSFGFWLGRGDFVFTRTGDFTNGGTIQANCGWNSWPKEIKGWYYL